ncbi:caspase family protein [uncultured Cohaesibacter sp.]|uniref:caspase family protein n=1 Tax=uncultured Cohaesibacter sp. TaxID=1002546 RepID=UPI00292FF203|nr:caspase family protein [uncultured Cohaesibacter sp.]
MRSHSDDTVVISFPDLSHREASVLAMEMRRELEKDLLEAGEQDFALRLYRENPSDQSLGASLLFGGAGVILGDLGFEVIKGAANETGRVLVRKIEALLKKYNTRGRIWKRDNQEIILGSRPDNEIRRMTELNALGVVILGASEFPNMPDDGLDNPNLKNSAEAVKRLFSERSAHSVFQKVEILDLFNTDLRADRIVDQIEQHVEDHPDINDLIIYYCGHGTYSGNNDQKYCLLLKNNINKKESFRSIVMEDFEYLIDNSNFCNKRIYFIIDACYAGAAVKHFQFVRPIQMIKQQIDALFVAKGRAILAAASKEKAAVGDDGSGLTMFTGAMIAVLSGESGHPPAYLSLEDLHKEITDYIGLRYKRRDGVVPECHTPGNVTEHISRTPIFVAGNQLPPILPEKSDLPSQAQDDPVFTKSDGEQDSPDDLVKRQKEAEKLFKWGEQYYLGKGIYEEDHKETLRFFKRSAELGHAPAQYYLGMMHEHGHGGLEADDGEATRFYMLAADQGYADAQNNLGVWYYTGAGSLEKDEAKAVQLFSLAAEQGQSGAQFNLGFMYEHGEGGLELDAVKAAYCYRLAADQGLADAQYRLGLMYEKGEGGLVKDETEAQRLKRLALDQGYQIVGDGESIATQDDATGSASDGEHEEQIFRRIVEQGTAEEQTNLGYNYYVGGGGLEEDMAKAAQLFMLAADQGQAEAQFDLGFMYEHGRGGLNKDFNKAAHYYGLAAAQGDKDAQHNLDLMHENGYVGQPRSQKNASPFRYNVALLIFLLFAVIFIVGQVTGSK